jgi:hypothetical protein
VTIYHKYFSRRSHDGEWRSRKQGSCQPSHLSTTQEYFCGARVPHSRKASGHYLSLDYKYLVRYGWSLATRLRFYVLRPEAWHERVSPQAHYKYCTAGKPFEESDGIQGATQYPGLHQPRSKLDLADETDGVSYTRNSQCRLPDYLKRKEKNTSELWVKI